MEKRAVVATICESKLLSKVEYARDILQIIDKITQDIVNEDNRKEDVLRFLEKHWDMDGVLL